MTDHGKRLRVRQYWFIKKTNAWVLTYTAEPEKFEKFERLAMMTMGSFKFY